MVQEVSAVVAAVVAVLTISGGFIHIIFRIGRESQKIKANEKAQNVFNSTCIDRLNKHGRVIEALAEKVNDIPVKIKEVQMDGLKEMHNAMADAFREIDTRYARKDTLDQLMRDLNKAY